MTETKVASSGFVDGPDLTAAVVPAVRAGAMRRFRFMTMRALAGLCGRQRIVRPPLGCPRFRVPPFGIGHSVILVFVDRRSSVPTCHLSLITCHLSLITCHLSLITYHLSLVTCHLSLTSYIPQCLQRREPWIFPSRAAVARAGVLIGSTLHAKSLAQVRT
jgi:hypothetical protein